MQKENMSVSMLNNFSVVEKIKYISYPKYPKPNCAHSNAERTGTLFQGHTVHGTNILKNGCAAILKPFVNTSKLPIIP